MYVFAAKVHTAGTPLYTHTYLFGNSFHTLVKVDLSSVHGPIDVQFHYACCTCALAYSDNMRIILLITIVWFLIHVCVACYPLPMHVLVCVCVCV